MKVRIKLLWKCDTCHYDQVVILEVTEKPARAIFGKCANCGNVLIGMQDNAVALCLTHDNVSKTSNPKIIHNINFADDAEFKKEQDIDDKIRTEMEDVGGDKKDVKAETEQ